MAAARRKRLDGRDEELPKSVTNATLAAPPGGRNTERSRRTCSRSAAPRRHCPARTSSTRTTAPPTTISAACPAGERAIGGGGAWLIPTLNGGNDPTALDRAFLSASMPTPAQPGTAAATGWEVAGRNVTGTNRILRVYAICVPNQIPAA
jgi:hypothetical protein